MAPLRTYARRQVKNAHAEAMQFRLRAAVAFAGVVVALLVLAGWYFRLQVLQHDDYVLRSEANRIKLQPVVPGRGLILDRKGRILADNVPAFRLDVVRDDAGDIDSWLPALSRAIALTPEELKRFREVYATTPSFRPVTLKLRVGEEEAAAFAVDRWRYPGVELVSYLNRRYPHGELLSHVIGYVSRVDAKDAEALGEGFSALTHIGKTGLERSYEEALRGTIGFDKIETNVDGRAMGRAGRVPAVPGADLRLSIDLDLQQAMADAFGDFDGSAVAVDPRTGEVLAMVSLPAYDANLFVNGISHADYQALTTSPSRPLFNRNVLGGGPPGSTVKPLIALAGLDSGLRRPETAVFSTGTFHIPGQRRGWRDAHGGAGWTNLSKSISASVNYYYYKLAYEMGIERFDAYMQKYGFGQPTGIDLMGERVGIVPSPEWKATQNKEPWYAGETVNAGIGQGYWIATVLQLARGTAAIANGGDLHPLHLASARRDGYGTPWVPIPHGRSTRITDSASNLAAVHGGMVATVHGGGTGAAMARGIDYLIAGKTGTAQKISRRGNSASVNPKSLPRHLRHQALFVGYAPADAPTIALAVSVEHGGYGGTTAAPIARKVFDAWLRGQMPEPLPPDQRHRGPLSEMYASLDPARAKAIADARVFSAKLAVLAAEKAGAAKTVVPPASAPVPAGAAVKPASTGVPPPSTGTDAGAVPAQGAATP